MGRMQEEPTGKCLHLITEAVGLHYSPKPSLWPSSWDSDTVLGQLDFAMLHSINQVIWDTPLKLNFLTKAGNIDGFYLCRMI